MSLSILTQKYEFYVLIFLVAAQCSGQRQQYNANADFLLHEGGRDPTNSKRDYVASQPQNTQFSGGRQDYNNQFPPLGSSSKRTTQNVISSPIPSTPSPTSRDPQQSSGKRDYVAPNLPNSSPISNTQSQKHANPQPTSGQRDFVGSKLPNSNKFSPGITSNSQTSTGKRDYVAPNIPAGNNNPNSGRVKDLINYYDSVGKNQNSSPKTPSYSSVLHHTGGSNGLPTSASSSTIKPIPNTPKPLSFSSVVAGPTAPNTPTSSTPKPLSNNPPRIPPKPVNPILPSSLSNKNQNTNSNGPSDAELQSLSEELLRKDTNNAAKYVTINYQEKTTSMSKEDKAPLPPLADIQPTPQPTPLADNVAFHRLLTIGPEVWNIPTIQKLVPLLDNYERDTLVNEYVTPQERHEENAFMDAIMATSVIRHLMTFLKDKGYVTPDPKQQRYFLKQLWFNLYSRGKGKISSSGFEHVFVSELKNGEVSGLHNWIYFSREETANRANYLGYLKHVDLNDKGAVVKLHFTQEGVDKPVNSLFIGTSLELEIALYTLCYVTRVDNDCKLKLANKDVNVVTYNFRYRSKNLIGSAFPQI